MPGKGVVNHHNRFIVKSQLHAPPQVTDKPVKPDAADEEPANGTAADAAPAADAAVEDINGEVSPDQKVVAKFLVSNAAAGSVIGKAGSNIGGATPLQGGKRQRGPLAFLYGHSGVLLAASASVSLGERTQILLQRQQ